jgi:hypothetical protein
MDWMSFALGLLGGFIGTMLLIVALLLIYARPFYQVAKNQRETQDKMVKNWAEQLAAAGKAQAEAQKTPPKWGTGNSG